MKKIIFIVIILTILFFVFCVFKYSNKEENNRVLTTTKKTSLTIEKTLSKYVPILMYHSINNKYFGDKTLFVKENDFDNQMKYLSDNNYTPLFLSEIERAKDYEKPIIITFDDGYMDNYTKALPILMKYNLKATVFIIANWTDGKTYMNQEQIKELSNSNIFEIGAHTLTHVFLSNMNYNDQLMEISQSKYVLENIINKDIIVFSYPYGSYNEDTLNISKKYYKYSVTVEEGINNLSEINNYKLKRYKISRDTDISSFINIVSTGKVQ